MVRKNDTDASAVEVTAVRKKPGRKPMTAAQKAVAAQQREALKKAAAQMKPELILQYQDGETDVTALIEAAKAEFQATHKRTLITGLKLYLKPEDGAAYYVINETETGKILM
ncbi:MAG: DUF6465 family protein [Oscillospiraceae bacterium]|nr:DUF6465 family protein [Oscillospiraceae bacterium]